MTDDTAIATTDRERKRSAALLKAIGLDKVTEPERELALAIAKRYDLDLLLGHLVLIEGRPYITRDGLLWIAHRSGQLDGIEVTDPVVVKLGGVDFWSAKASVYRRDMTRPFTYSGRYPVRGRNVHYGPEMAVKVAESMALRRAFNISAPSQDERWDVESAPTTALPEEARPTPSKAMGTIRARLGMADSSAAGDDGADGGPPPSDAAPRPQQMPEAQDPPTGDAGGLTGPPAAAPAPDSEAPGRVRGDRPQPAAAPACGAISPYDDDARCVLPTEHVGYHRAGDKSSWGSVSTTPEYGPLPDDDLE